MQQGSKSLLKDIRSLWSQTLVLKRPGQKRESIGNDIASGLADLEANGKMVLANPDFIECLVTDAPCRTYYLFRGGRSRLY